ncbi:hypothetical protein Tco_0503578 [Tanacetum coccineum]
MANLEFCYKHNMVAYLKKPTRSKGFQEIVDFLNGSHIRYALTKNPTIYVSLIEKFWQSSTVRTIDNGEQEITATVDGKEFTITEASVRRHLQLADVDGISVLLTTEIFDQLSLMGYQYEKRFSGENTPLFPSILAIHIEEGEGSGHPSEPQPPPSTAQPTNEEPIPNVVSSSHQNTQTPRQALNQVPRSHGGSIALTRSERVPTPPRDSPLPRVYILGSDEGSMTLQELTIVCTTLSKKVESLEADLKKTKQVYGAAYTKLVMKVKKLKKNVNTSHSKRRAKFFVSDNEEDSEDSSKQGRMIEEIDQDTRVTLVTPTQGDDQPEVWVNISIPSPVVVKDKAQSFTEEEWENIRARVEANEELSRRLQAEEMNKYSETEDRGRASKLVTGSSQLTIINSAKVGSSKRAAEEKFDYEGSKRQKTNEALGLVQEQLKEEELSNIQSLTGRFTLKNLENIRRSSGLDDLVMLWNLVKERFSSTEPTDDKERTRVELKRVHHVSTEKGTDIFMLEEKEYLLSKGVLTLMLVNRLLVEQHSKMANELLRKIFIQANRPRQ